MIFHDPDTLHLWIDLFFAVAAAAVLCACAAVTVGIRDLRRPAATRAARVAHQRFGQVRPETGRRAA